MTFDNLNEINSISQDAPWQAAAAEAGRSDFSCSETVLRAAVCMCICECAAEAALLNGLLLVSWSVINIMPAKGSARALSFAIYIDWAEEWRAENRGRLELEAAKRKVNCC